MDKDKEKLFLRVDKIKDKIEKSGLKDYFIAEKTGIHKTTLSCFLNKVPSYVTRSMCDRLEEFFEENPTY